MKSDNVEEFIMSKNSMEKPYISFVVTGRNDNYGHNFLGRFQNFFDNLSYLCEKDKLHSELIVVDWNPPKGKKKMKDALKIPSGGEFLKIRFIEVSSEIHMHIKNPYNLPMLEYNAKNVGIRRAKGEFVLCANPDIIFNRSLIDFISKKNLKSGEVYRIARNDLCVDIPEGTPIHKLEAFCKKNKYRTLGIFYKMHFPRKDTDFIKYFLRSFGTMFGKVANCYIKGLRHLSYMGGAPGDFTLMSKKDWLNFRGYKEATKFRESDEPLMFYLFNRGLKLTYIRSPNKIYHQYHNKNDVGIKRKRLNYDLLSKDEFENIDNSWGLKKIVLNEVTK